MNFWIYNNMKNLNKTTKTILFASLIAAMILPVTMADSAFAETRDDKIQRLGNEGKNLKEKITIERDSDKKERFEQDFEELKSQMRAIGIPTVEEYESDKSYWRDISVQNHLNELDRIKEASKRDNMRNVSYTEIQCSSCGDDDNKVAQFQTAYAYDCYVIWTCNAYAPSWVYLSDGQSNSQVLTVGSDHSWIDPFWLVSGNQQMNITYTYHHVNYDDGGSQIGNTYSNGDVQYISSSSDVDTVSKSDRVSSPRANYSVDTQWTISSIS